MIALPLLLLLSGPLNSAEVIRARSAPVQVAQWVVSTATIGTTPVALTGDIGAVGATWTQSLRVSNRSATAEVCVAPVARAVSCAAACAASGITCGGVATDGDPIASKSPYTIALLGSSCLCGVASAAGTIVTTASVHREGQ
jgi:hypothetical protein